MDLLKFPFLSDVWGSVSDWAMILVTAITARYLYFSLKSQKEIQKMQKRITDIEDFRFRNAMMPKFVAKGNATKYPFNTKDTIRADYWLELVNSNSAKNIKIKGLLNDDESTFEKEWNKGIASPEDNKVSIEYQFNTTNIQKCAFGYKLNVTFEDMAGHKYHQYIEILRPDRNKKSGGQRTEPTLLADSSPDKID